MGHLCMIRIIPFIVEFLMTIFMLAWFASAYPDKYRTTLWAAGGDHGWNSNPRMRIYYYANYQEPPEIPLIWSQSLTESNLAIAVLAVLVCLARGILFFYHAIERFVTPIYDLLLCGFWTYSAMAQSSSDLSEKDRWSIRPWYLERSCTDVQGEAIDACVFAKISYIFAIILTCFYLVRSIFSILGLAYWCGQRRLLEYLGERLPAEFGCLTTDDGYGRILLSSNDTCECGQGDIIETMQISR